MKISLFTRRLEDAARVAQLRAAAAAATDHGAAMLVLPGRSLGKDGTTGRVLRTLASRTGLSILGEAGDTYCFIPDGEPIGPFVPRFATSAQATRTAVEDLVQGYRRGERVLQVAHTCIRVVLAGESNVLRAPRARGAAAEPRYPDLGWDDTYDVLVNPAHRSVKQWSLHHKRFAWFSRSGRTALYCANCSGASWRTALAVYRDGRRVTLGDLEGDHGLPTCIRDAWRLVTVDLA